MGLFNRLFGKKSLTPAPASGWQPLLVSEPFTGAWQKNAELRRTDLQTYHAVFACLSLISSDIGKLRFYPKKLQNGVLQIAKSKADRLLKRPNNYQTWQQFAECWAGSKASRGNTYVLKQRDLFGDIYRLHVLNPDRVTPLISDVGEVFYQIAADKLPGLTQQIVIPASEIIHDRFNCLYHPLVGLSPITACAISAGHGLAIQNNSTVFFNNASRPGGILTVPQQIDQPTADDIKARWRSQYNGVNSGDIAVLGDGVSYQGISISAGDAQLIEQLKLTGEITCSVFHVPAFKVGLGAIPSGVKVQDLNDIYLRDCLQTYIEAMENLLDIALELEPGTEIEADLKSLLRMDSATQMDYLTKGTGGGIISPNEARAEIGLPPVGGGDSPLMQQQNYSLSALAKRDAKDDPFSKSLPAPAQTPENNAKTVIHHRYQPPSEDKTAENPPKMAEKPTFDDLYKGKFDANFAYAKGDFMSKNSGLWVAKCDSQGVFDHQNWQLVSKNGGES